MIRIAFASLLLISINACKSKTAVDTKPSTFEVVAAEDVLSEKRHERNMRCLPILRTSQLTEQVRKTNMITRAEIERGCLQLEYSYSGCKLGFVHVYYERIENTNPQELALFIGVRESGDCDMLLEGNGSFNLGDIEGHTAGKVILNIDGHDTPLTYIYTAE